MLQRAHCSPPGWPAGLQEAVPQPRQPQAQASEVPAATHAWGAPPLIRLRRRPCASCWRRSRRRRPESRRQTRRRSPSGQQPAPQPGPLNAGPPRTWGAVPAVLLWLPRSPRHRRFPYWVPPTRALPEESASPSSARPRSPRAAEAPASRPAARAAARPPWRYPSWGAAAGLRHSRAGRRATAPSPPPAVYSRRALRRWASQARSQLAWTLGVR
mmetsp:Transcript_10398/g.29344  ORF Transcript_10398/g.29344 Transcript_10398/m.29344 type:complete len:214 (-) Transcript_10398:408-1049(-)